MFQPENLQQWTEKVGGRFLPAMPELLQTPFWQNMNDPHFAAIQTLSAQNTQPYLPFVHPVYGDIREGRFFVDALIEVISGKRSPEEAADRAIAAIEAVVNQD